MNGLDIGSKKITMRRYWIEKKQIDLEQNVHFIGDQFHHIFDVCRQEAGHHFEVITEDSKAYLVEVKEVGKKSALATIVEERQIKNLETPHIHIALAVSRYPVMDAIMEKAVEMGVKSILPFVSEYSFVRKEKEVSENKIERWKKIVVSATQQCGRGELMTIHDIHNVKTAITKINPSESKWCLFAYEGADLKPVKQEIYDLKIKYNHSADQKPEEIWIIVGSEGGFSTKEVHMMQELGLHPVTLGSQILRVETACLTLVAALKYEFGLMK